MEARGGAAGLRDRRRRRAGRRGEVAGGEDALPVRTYAAPPARARGARGAVVSRCLDPRRPSLPPRMTTHATEIVFLPGFDGDASLRAPFVEAVAERRPARAIGYPNRTMGSLNGYARYVAGELPAESRP